MGRPRQTPVRHGNPREAKLSPRSQGPYQIQIAVTPDFNLAATMGFIDPFRAANYLEGQALFRWRFVSEHGGVLSASNGGGLDTTPLSQAQDPGDLFVLSSSWTPETHGTPALLAAVRRAALRKTPLGGIDTGAFILAEAGLLKGHSATVHYEHIDALQELYPEIDVLETLCVFDKDRLTCCGGLATVEFALHILQRLHGHALANAAARYIFAPNLRAPGAPQNPQETEPLGATVPAAVRRVIKLMEETLETPLPIGKLCETAQISHRQLDRLFAQYLGKTPALYYRDIRLDRARGLVTQTTLSMSEIAYASGFSSQVHFSRAYKARFGLPPSRDRIEGRIPFEFRAWPMHRRPNAPE